MNLTQEEFDQVSRILTKITILESYDPDHKIFGASSHMYKWHEPASLWDVEAFEEKHKVELPRDYKIFLTFISNGAPFVAYGLYPLEKLEVLGELNRDNILYPHMQNDDFKTLVDTIEIDLKKDPTEEIYNGLLIIGTEGCTYDFALVVSGKYRGRILLTDGDLDSPFIFSYELGFLDLYERWLDAFTNKQDPSKVLFTVPKGKDTLIKDYLESNDTYYKKDILSTFESYEVLGSNDIENLKHLYSSEDSLILKSHILKIMLPFDEEFSTSHIKDHLYSNDINLMNHFIQHEASFYTFLDDDYKQLIKQLEEIADHNHLSNPNCISPNFSQAVRLLRNTEYHRFETFKPFLKHTDSFIVETAIFMIGDCKDFRDHKQELLFLLDSDDANIVRETLQVLIKHTMSDEYLETFRPLITKFKDDDFIPSHIERYLHKIKKPLDYYN